MLWKSGNGLLTLQQENDNGSHFPLIRFVKGEIQINGRAFPLISPAPLNNLQFGVITEVFFRYS
jgi:hypothetical protein